MPTDVKGIHNATFTVNTKPGMTETILSQGYPAFPCRFKTPVLDNFQKRDFQCPISEARKYDAFGFNTGLSTNLFPTVDIDIPHYELSIIIQQLAYDLLAPAPIRVGEDPKAAIIYRLAHPDMVYRSRNITAYDAKGVKYEVQILAEGKQVIIAGTHPDTKKPYRWQGKMPFDPGTDYVWQAVTPDMLDAFIDAVRVKFQDFGLTLTKPDQTQTGDSPYVEVVDAETVKRLMRALPNNHRFDDRDEWVRTAYACCGAFGDAHRSDARDAFHEWSSRWHSYDADATDALLDSIPLASTGRLATGGWVTLYDIARQSGLRVTSAQDAFPDPLPETGRLGKPSAVPYDIFAVEPADLKPLPRLMGNHYIRGYLSTLSAPGAHGKSTILLAEALCLTTGTGHLGYAVQKGAQKVLYLSKEDSLFEIAKRARAMLKTWDSAAPADGMLSIRSREHLSQSFISTRDAKGTVRVNDAFVDALHAAMVRDRIDVLMIDPLANFAPFDLGNEDMLNIGLALASVADDINASVMIAHHLRKGGVGQAGVDRTVDDLRGGSALPALARSNRLIAHMPAQDAASLGVPPNRAAYYRKVWDDKANFEPRGQDAHWLEFVSVDMNNAADGYPSDKVPAVQWYQPPDAQAVVQDHVVAALRFIDERFVGPQVRGDYSFVVQYAAHADCGTDLARAVIGDILQRDWVMVVQDMLDRDVSRRMRDRYSLTTSARHHLANSTSI